MGESLRKLIILTLLIFSILWADSPISRYDRFIDQNKQIIYKHTDGNFSFTAKKLIDSDNIYNQGSVDNYDDAYIQRILKNQTPFQTIKGSSDKTIHIVFKSKANRDNFLGEFGLDIFKQEKLGIKLYMMDAGKLTLPLNLSVYPLFVINDRFLQGVISKKLLKGLILQSDYSHKEKISLENLKKRISEKYNMTKDKVDLKYNEKIELFEVHKKDESRMNSYISRDGRYILVL